MEIVAELGEVNQGNDHVGIGGGGQAVGIAAGDGQPPVLILEVKGFLPVRGIIRKQGYRELGEIQSRPGLSGVPVVDASCRLWSSRWPWFLPSIKHDKKQQQVIVARCPLAAGRCRGCC